MVINVNNSMTIATTIVAITGECKRSLTSASLPGNKRSNDQAKRLRVPIRTAGGWIQKIAARKVSAIIMWMIGLFVTNKPREGMTAGKGSTLALGKTRPLVAIAP